MFLTYDGQPQYSRGHVVVLDAQIFLQPQYDLTNNTLCLLYYILDAQPFLRPQSATHRHSMCESLTHIKATYTSDYCSTFIFDLLKLNL